MNILVLKDKLHQFLEIADDEKLKAIYVILEDAINDVQFEYSDEYKIELDRRVSYYLNGGEMVTPSEMNKRLATKRKQRI